jgi:predicted neutral ceramidase superfamily lipid hydrolase
MDKYEYLDKVNKLQQEAFRLDIQGWFKNELFTLEWWVIVALFIVPWMLWFKFADKNKMLEALLFGTFVMISTSYLDSIGMEFEFWVYPTKLLPIAPRAIPFDISMVPVAFMFLYQYFETWKSYIIALIVISTLIAFVGEPFAVWMEFVQYIKWHYIYSFFYYMLIGVTFRWLIVKLKENTHKAKGGTI